MTLVEQIISGDVKAINKLYQAYERKWFRICLRYASNRSDAQDIMQEGTFKVFRDIGQYDAGRGTFSAWSNRVMINAALNYLKKHQWQSAFDDLESVLHKASLEESSLDRLSAQEITSIIQQLPTGYRVVFNLFEVEGYSHREVADMLNISVGTSKSQLAKAKKMLRRKIEILL